MLRRMIEAITTGRGGAITFGLVDEPTPRRRSDTGGKRKYRRARNVRRAMAQASRRRNRRQ